MATMIRILTAYAVVAAVNPMGSTLVVSADKLEKGLEHLRHSRPGAESDRADESRKEAVKVPVFAPSGKEGYRYNENERDSETFTNMPGRRQLTGSAAAASGHGMAAFATADFGLDYKRERSHDQKGKLYRNEDTNLNLASIARAKSEKGSKAGKSTSAPSTSSQPSTEPSTSSVPSSNPSEAPSSTPSENPSTSPSSFPSSSPSSQPSISGEPSSQPSSHPSSVPSTSSQPSVTLTPTGMPTGSKSGKSDKSTKTPKMRSTKAPKMAKSTKAPQMRM